MPILQVQLGGHFEDELDDEQAVCADQLAEEPGRQSMLIFRLMKGVFNRQTSREND